jgi:hypothetical protein
MDGGYRFDAEHEHADDIHGLRAGVDRDVHHSSLGQPYPSSVILVSYTKIWSRLATA